MPFAEKLASLRKQKGFTQEELAGNIGVGVAQIKRYEKGASSPTLQVIRNIARTLGISADELIFDENEGVASTKIMDRKLLEQFEMISSMPPHDRETVKTVLESMIIRSRLEEIMPSRTDAAWAKEMRKVVTELRKGAEQYSEQEIDQLVDEAVTAVRGGKHRKAKEAVGS